mmetsp:Transcript_33215/g.91920  ORF Transcript_33215/g.91920 Transcript_33215/m.91920 type:complete len:255 (+) Transcript_33215:281-1045(+)
MTCFTPSPSVLTSLVYHILWGEPIEHADKAIRKCEHEALQPIGLPIHDNGEDHQHRQEQDGEACGLEVQVKALTENLCCEHREGHDKDGDLRARADGDSNGGSYFVVIGHAYCGRVLAGVADNGQENHPDKGLRDAPVSDEAIDRAHHVLRQLGDDDCADEQQAQGPRDAQDGRLVVRVLREERHRARHYLLLSWWDCRVPGRYPVPRTGPVHIERPAEGLNLAQVADLQVAVDVVVQLAALVCLDCDLLAVRV